MSIFAKKPDQEYTQGAGCRCRRGLNFPNTQLLLQISLNNQAFLISFILATRSTY